MKPTDRELGLHRAITRRDFVHDVSLGALALGLPLTALSSELAPPTGGYYPPTRTGLRGSHPGAFETAHALAREGKAFADPVDLDEQYDLIVVGAGISGLAAAYFYRQQHSPDSRILLLDNHDDFGGHAKRNEFHQGGPMRLAWGGTVNIVYPLYSDVAMGLLSHLGVSIERLLEDFEFSWSEGYGGMQSAIFFDADTYGADQLLPGLEWSEGDLAALAAAADQFPISPEGRDALKTFFTARTDVLANLDDVQRQAYLHSTSYPDFLRQHFNMPDDAVQLCRNATGGMMGLKAEYVSVAECVEIGLPGAHVLGGKGQRAADEEYNPAAMFPDGNSSITRLLVRSLIPAAFPEFPADADAHRIATQRLDYAQLDQPGAPVRLRLNSTVVHAENENGGVAVSYARDGELVRVRAGRAVMACYNNIIRHLVPELPAQQKTALAKCVKRPLMVANVMLRNGQALKAAGISGAYLPGSYLENMCLVTGVNVGDYRPEWQPEDACVMQFFASLGTPEPVDLPIVEQSRVTRSWLLEQKFEDFEREIRRVLHGIYGKHGLNVADDILAIMVNRWPHGYARDHLDLEDADWNADPAPNVIGRQRCGNIVIANSDAGADAYTHVAIDQAWRAVNELAGN